MADKTRLDLRIDSSAVHQELAGVRRRLADMTPLMRELAGILEASSQEAFEDEADPASGLSWRELSDEYIDTPRSQGGRGGAEHPILQLNGYLAKLTTDYGPTWAAVGSNEPYAAIHQFGGLPSMAPGPAAIPARPYLGLSAPYEREVLESAERYVQPT